MIDRIVLRSFPLFRLISIVFLMLCACTLQAQDRLLPAYRFARITTQNGLPSNEIRSNVVRDRRGFYWIGTLKGLARYDGRGCKVYRNIPGDPHSIPMNIVLWLHLDRRGLLWIGTYNAGLSIFDPATDRFVNIPPESTRCGWTSPSAVFCLHEDRSGNIWIGSEKEVILADLSQAANETSAEGIARLVRFRMMASGGFGTSVNCIDDWDEQSVLIASNGGLCIVDRTTGARKNLLLPATPGLNLDTTAVMVFRRETPDRIWFGTLSQGLVLYDRARGVVRRYHRHPNGIATSADYVIGAMQFDRSGRLWLGTRYGIELFDPSAGVYLDDMLIYHPNISPRQVWSCELDDTGNLWFGSYERGVYVLRTATRRFPLYVIPKEDELPRDMETIERNADGTYWISTEGRTVRVDLSTFRILQNVDIFGKDKPLYGRKGVWDSYRDKNGNIWYGTWGCGLYRFNPSTGRVFQFRLSKRENRQTTSADACISISGASGDSLWIAAFQSGVLLFDPRTGTFNEQSPLSQFNLFQVWHIMQDHEGRMWVSDQLAGLTMFDPASHTLSRFQHHADQPGSISTSLVVGTFEDPGGKIWVGSDMINLWQPETKTFQHFPKARRFGPPFDANFTKPLGTDCQGKLWVGYYSLGMSILDPATGENISFTAADGLCGGMPRDMSLLPDGRVMLVGSQGMNLISPDSLSAPTAPPPVVISAVVVNDSSLAPKEWMSPGSIVQLPHDQNTLEFEFAAIDPAVPEDIRCSYRLEGLSESWISPPDRYYARYPGLQPGSYRLRVKASSLLGHWPDQEISLAISISPPWWHTLWFRAVLVLVLASALYGLYRYRMSKILALERVRLRIADDLHDDIGSELSGIALESDLIARQLPAGTPQQTRLLMLGQTVRKASGDLRDVVWFVNPEFDKLPDLVARMRTVANKMLTGHQVTFDIPADIPPVPLGMEFKRHLLMMFKEMLNNIVRHAKAQNVRILLELDGMHFKLCVKDDGIGFDTSMESAGRGLVLLRSRTTAIGGRCTLESGPNSGTTICIEGDIIRSED